MDAPKPQRPTGGHYLHAELSKANARIHDLLDELVALETKHAEELAVRNARIAELEGVTDNVA